MEFLFILILLNYVVIYIDDIAKKIQRQKETRIEF